MADLSFCVRLVEKKIFEIWVKWICLWLIADHNWIICFHRLQYLLQDSWPFFQRIRIYGWLQTLLELTGIWHLPSSRRDRSSILIFCRASSSSAHLERSFSKASFMSPYCNGTAGWGGGAIAPLVVVPTSSLRRPNIPCSEREQLRVFFFVVCISFNKNVQLALSVSYTNQTAHTNLYFEANYLFLFGGLVHFGLEEVNKFGLLGDGSLHLHLLVRVYSLQEGKQKLREGSTSEDIFKKNSLWEHVTFFIQNLSCYFNMNLTRTLSSETTAFHLSTKVLHWAPVYSPAGIPDRSSQSWACQFGPGHPGDLGSNGKCGSSGGPSAAGVSLAVEMPPHHKQQ